MLGCPSQLALEPALLPLTPSEALDYHSSTSKSRDPSKSCNANPLHSPPDHRDLLAEDPVQDFSLGLNAENNLNPFNLNLLSQDLVDAMEDGPYAENLVTSGNAITQDLLTSSAGGLLFDDNIVDEDGLPSPLNDLIEDSAILDEIRLLDLALEEGFSPEMAARLDEEGYLYRDIAQQETGRDDDHSHSSMMVSEDQDQTTYHQGKQ